MQPPHINVGKLLRRFTLSLLAPFAVAVVVDQWMGTAPLLTVAAIAICLPLATVVVSRTALKEMGRVIEAVAPASPRVDAADPDTAGGVPRPN